jgi:hypothetical protein
MNQSIEDASRNSIIEDANAAGFELTDDIKYYAANIDQLTKFAQLREARQSSQSEPIYFYRNRESEINGEIMYSGWHECNKSWFDQCNLPHHVDKYYQTRIVYTAPQQAIPSGFKLVPIKPSDEHITSMAIRSDHGLGVPGYYDTLPIQFGATHAQRMESTKREMRQLYEEAIGEGFYKLSASPTAPIESDK